MLTWTLKNLKNLHFNGLLLNKVYNVWAKKKYRRVLLDGTEYWCNIWRKTDLYFQKWHKEFSKLSPEHVRKCKNWNFDGILLSKVKNLWAQNLQGKFVSWQEWYKIWRGIDLSVQNWHEEFDKFWPEHSKISKICTLMGFFWTKYIIFELKKV